MIIPAKSQFNWLSGFSQEDFLNFSQWEHIMDPGSHVGFQISTKNTNLVWDHPMNISGKFGWNLFSGFREEDLNVKSWQTDGRTDGRWTLTHNKSSDELKWWKCEIPTGSNVKLSRVMAAILNFRSTNNSQFYTGQPTNHSCKVTIQWLGGFWQEDF